MPATPSSQTRFATALANLQATVPSELVPTHRFSAYRNNVHSGLRKALGETYPVVKRLVGPAFFDAMAEKFIAKELPASPVLTEYGEEFALLIDEFCSGLSQVPYLADIARLEWAQQCSYHEAEAEPINPQALAAMAPADVNATTFQLHPSLRLLQSPWPIHAIWETNRSDEQVRPVELKGGGQSLMLLRPQAQVNIHHLLPGGFEFILALQNGESLGTASKLALANETEFDLASTLQAMFEHGAICGYHSGLNSP